MKRIKIIIFLEILTVLLLLGRLAFRSNPASPAGLENSKDFIKWVDFTVPEEALTQAFRMDVATCQQEPHLNWVELLAYLGARYGGDFSRYRSSDLTQLAEKIKDGASLEELTGNLKYYSYYREAYGAVLDGMVG
ncbi:MAG: M23 family peptidase, partial [Clostridiaceae bacterium]|nr:M23 family peptidase [Clostridiaceae bacterium]